MHKNHLTELLQEIGLTEHEAQVYFSALSLGPSTVLKIAKAAEIKRTTVYTVIESLTKKGLMNIEVRGFKKLFVAETPEKLDSILEGRRAEFKRQLPEFLGLYNLKGGESFIKYYEGLEAVKSIYEGLIRDIRPHEDYLVMSNQDYWLRLDEKYFRDFGMRRAKLPIKIRMMVLDTEGGREFQKLERNLNSRIKILPEKTTLVTNLIITPQRVVFHQLTAPIIAIVIENKSIIQMHREMYEIIWNSIQ
ncbi:hypothetical protein EPO17_01975 [Patescibacteria group bacterium]|nr:MAG: hypothetical protein EPO17_01975 [Patescibacteria group bacterium]